MSTTRSIDQTDVICGLNTSMTALECHHNAQLLNGQEGKAKCKTSPVAYVTIPVLDVIGAKKEKSRREPTCNKRVPVKDGSVRKARCRADQKLDRREKTYRLIFPEMRGGVLYSKCCCLHRNGLQDHCPLSQCQGQSQCLAIPWAVCPPAKFVRLRYPELYPKTSNTS